MTTTTKIAGEAMTDEQISEIIEEFDGGSWIDDEYRINCKDMMRLARALLASKADGPQAVERNAPYLPCPICKGIEGCDHPVPERKRAAEKAIYQNRVEGFESAWRDVSKETFDECSAIKTFETRIVYSAPQPVRQTASATHIVLTGEQKIALDTGIAAMRRCGWHYYVPILKQILAASPTAPAQSCGDAEQADEAVTLPKPRETWYVRIRDASTLATFEVIEVSAGTVLVKSPGSYYENRYEIGDLKFIEIARAKDGK